MKKIACIPPSIADMSLQELSMVTGIDVYEIKSMIDAMNSFGNKSEMDIEQAKSVLMDYPNQFSEPSTRKQKRLNRIRTSQHLFKKYMK